MTTAADASSRDPVRILAYLRAWNILFRTAHVGAVGALFGGHVFGVAEERLVPWLYASILTGVGLAVIESLSELRWCMQLAGVMMIGKVLLLIPTLWLWDYRIPILVAVIVLGSVGSHMPKRYRHHPILVRK